MHTQHTLEQELENKKVDLQWLCYGWAEYQHFHADVKKCFSKSLPHLKSSLMDGRQVPFSSDDAGLGAFSSWLTRRAALENSHFGE